jgi:hypothetical protein
MSASTQLNRITFREAVRKVHADYGIYSQFTVWGDTVDTFELTPRTDKFYDAVDMRNLETDMDFLTELIKEECK